MSIQEISIKDYSYTLPDNKIAKYPLEKRDESKLLCFHKGEISDYHFKNLPSLLKPGNLLVYNNTKVIHARLLFQKESGAQIEIFCLEPMKFDYAAAFNATAGSTWHCMIGNKKRWKGEKLSKELRIGDKQVLLSAQLIDGEENLVEFSWSPAAGTFGEVLYYAGLLPIPPYLNREAEAKDESGYQTYFAKTEGSVAAPTAGLHFTDELIQNLKKASVRTDELTLHVGAGTFLPVKSEKISDHVMHQEHVQIHLKTIQNILQTLVDNQSIISVGTTSMRSLESLYWHAVNVMQKRNKPEHMDVTQWQPYEKTTFPEAKSALAFLVNDMLHNNISEIVGETQILIAPGYQFKLVDGLVTNFHQPNSTLLLLVAAFVGEDWEKIYAHALNNQYRFLSFGDGSLLWRNQ